MPAKPDAIQASWACRAARVSPRGPLALCAAPPHRPHARAHAREREKRETALWPSGLVRPDVLTMERLPHAISRRETTDTRNHSTKTQHAARAYTHIYIIGRALHYEFAILRFCPSRFCGCFRRAVIAARRVLSTPPWSHAVDWPAVGRDPPTVVPALARLCAQRPILQPSIICTRGWPSLPAALCHHRGGAAHRSRHTLRFAAVRVSMRPGQPNAEATGAYVVVRALRSHPQAMAMLIMGCCRS